MINFPYHVNAQWLTENLKPIRKKTVCSYAQKYISVRRSYKRHVYSKDHYVLVWYDIVIHKWSSSGNSWVNLWAHRYPQRLFAVYNTHIEGTFTPLHIRYAIFIQRTILASNWWCSNGDTIRTCSGWYLYDQIGTTPLTTHCKGTIVMLMIYSSPYLAARQIHICWVSSIMLINIISWYPTAK